MTLTVICSVGGAPGCTTLACLLAAVSPLERAAVVAECDPAGGVLASRFRLSPRVGTTSFVLAARHAAAGRTDLDPHLQQLPGGLEVLAGPAGSDAARIVDRECQGLTALAGAGRAVVVDAGRLDPSATGQQALVGLADAVVVVTTDERGAVARVAAAADHLARAARGAVGLAVVTGRSAAAADAARTAGLQLAAAVPLDGPTAAVVRGDQGRRRRLARAPLVRAAGALHSWADEAARSTPWVVEGSGSSGAATSLWSRGDDGAR